MKDRIKAIRGALSITQDEMAKRLEVTRGLVNRWEHGAEVPAPRRVQICSVFGVKKEWLDSGVGEMFASATEAKTNAVLDWLKAAFEGFTKDEQRSILVAMAKNPRLFFASEFVPEILVDYLIDTGVSI